MAYLARRGWSMDSSWCWRSGCMDRQAIRRTAARTPALPPPDRIEHHRERAVGLAAMLRMEAVQDDASLAVRHRHRGRFAREVLGAVDPAREQNVARVVGVRHQDPALDRKSTRLNSSHVAL